MAPPPLISPLPTTDNFWYGRTAEEYLGDLGRLIAALVNGNASIVASGSFIPIPATYQSGTISIVAGQQGYNVVFSPVMNSAPTKVRLSYAVPGPSGAGQAFGVVVDASSISAAGMALYLDGIPVSADGGYIFWEAQV